MRILGYFIFTCTFIVICFKEASCESCSDADEADIIFLVDGSGSVGSYGFDKSLEFLNRIVDSFQIGPHDTQVSVAVFESNTNFLFRLNEYSTKSDLKSRISTISYPTGGTNISGALDQVRPKFQDPSFGRRLDVTGIAVLMTDGQSYPISDSIDAAQRLKDINITVYTAGVGSGVNETELRSIATKPSYYFSCSDYSSLTSIVGPLTSSACTDINGCICYNGGTCVSGNLGYSCNCPPAYGGFYCEKSICEVASPCKNGHCSTNGDNWLCTCYPGFTDNTCSTDINGCICYNGGTCVQGNQGYSCNCPPAYGGFYCEKSICEVASPCKNGHCSTNGDNWLCTCYPGFTDNTCSTDIDECSSNPCVHGTCSDRVNRFVCVCTPGYTGILCEEEIDECATNPCQHDGNCTDLINAFTCDCIPGYTGLKCEIDINECISSPCEHGGTCKDRVNGYTCDCPSGYYGDYCETDIDKCSSNPCVHGTCSDRVNRFVCVCTPGYTGILCEEEIDECATNPCQHDGNCTDLINAFTCDCIPGYTGLKCEIDINECISSPCEHGGTCKDRVNGYTCDCPSGYYGDYCETDIDECSSNPCVHGTCSDRVNRFVCVCTPGYTGILCEEEIDECATNPCQHDGNCTDLINAFTCDCIPGYTGLKCEIDINECISSPCEHGGTCKDRVNGYTCDCPSGYYGDYCETDIDECSSNPCVHGTCSDRVNRFVCVCTPGYTGILCEEEIDECATNPCQHDGNCTDLINAFTCDCIPGYTGLKCEIDINECISSPCEHGGTCKDRVNGYTCDCPSGYYGDYCETGICQPSVADIVFVLDSSISQTEQQFNKQLEFINQFIDQIVIGDKNLQVGVVTFSFKAKIEIQIGQYNDNTTLKEAVSNIKYRPGATFTDKGLEAAIGVFNQAPAKRPYDKIAKRYVYVMTDGMSNNRKKTAEKANELKAVVNKVLAIGIGSQVSHEELLTIASKDTVRDRKYVYSVQNFDALYTILKELVKLTCDECTWETNADIVFILDDTLNELQTALNGITYLTQKTMLMEDENSTVRIGLVTYGSDVKLQRGLNDTTPKNTFLAQIQTIVRKDAQCSADRTSCDEYELDKAIELVRENVFESNNSNATSETRELIIVLSNGRDEINNKLNSELDKLRTENRKIFAISLGEEADIETLQKIVGDPALVFVLVDDTSMSVLDALTTDFFFSVCDLSNEF